jgi:hypothetical protein
VCTEFNLNQIHDIRVLTGDGGIISSFVGFYFLLGLFFDPEEGEDKLFRKVGCVSTGYTVLYSRR